MLAYFDSSALVPLVIDEPSTARVRTAWNAAHRVTTSLLSYVEARAALARAERSHRIGSDQHQQAIIDFDRLMGLRHADHPGRIDRAQRSSPAALHRLRGYDAVQCATSLAVATDEMVAVSGDLSSSTPGRPSASRRSTRRSERRCEVFPRASAAGAVKPRRQPRRARYRGGMCPADAETGAERRAALVYNPDEGRGGDPPRFRDDARAACRVGRALFYETTVDDLGDGVTREALEAGATSVLVAGGDGTVRAVSEAMVDTGIPSRSSPAAPATCSRATSDCP